MKRQLLAMAMCSLLGAAAYGQSNQAEYFSAQDVQQKLAGLAPKAQSSGSSGATLGDYTTHKIQLSVRTASGGAEVHAHYDDIFVVQQGHATLITGGTVIDPKTSPDGETKGSGISDGHSQEIAAGDVVHIPAGTPHQLKIASGSLFSSIVVKVKE
jgi:mannose-6-phosphate isomerase-like protein (cupin superfamily)